MGREEADALLGDVGQRQEADHLEASSDFSPDSELCTLTGDLPATICEDVVIPSLEFMSTTHGIKDILARLEAQVVCVVQA